MKIANELRPPPAPGQMVNGRPVVAKLDSTRDIRGSFYAPGEWKNKHRELGQALEREFKVRFRDNGNTFNTCFQFEGQFNDGKLHGRIKIYWKSLALIQSETVVKTLGMNMKALYYPSVRMGQALSESRNEGQSRIEITYSAANEEAEAEILNGFFYLRTEIDLDRVERALKSVDGLCWHLPLHHLLDEFVKASRQR